MTKGEIIAIAIKAGYDEHHAKFDTRLETFANLIAEKEYEKTSAWYRKLIADTVSYVHKEYEKKSFRKRINKVKVQV
jgi:hypothetical protein